ncbi:MAG: phasin family protein [Alphaproteobacteria bacterium]
MTKSANTPFLGSDFMKFMDFSKMMEMPKAFQDFKMPGMVDMEAVMDAQRKNMQALAAANQMAIEGMQAVLRRQSEIMRQGMEESSKLMNGVAASASAEEKIAKQAELTKNVLDRTLGNAKELAEMLTRSNYEALEVISTRVGESLEELRGMMKDVKPPGRERSRD